MDDPQNRPGSTTRPDLESQARPIGEAPAGGAPAPRTGTGGAAGSDPSDEPRGEDVEDVARQEGERVAAEAREQAREVVDTAHQGVAEVAEEAKHQVIDLAEDARRHLHDQARQQTDTLGRAVQDLGHKLHALADGRPDESGQVADYTDRIADQVDRIGDRVQELGFDGTVDELQRFARRRPGVFLLGAATAGFAVSRLGRGAKEAQEQGRSELDRGRTPRSRPEPSPMSNQRQDAPARAGQAPLAPPTSPTVGGVPSDVPPPPRAVPAPDPTMPRGRP